MINLKNIAITAAVALVVAIGVVMVTRGDSQVTLTDSQINEIVANLPLGGITNYDGLEIIPVDLNDGFRLGSTTSTNHQKFLSGTCNGSGPSAGVDASSTTQFLCTATGARPGDKVFVSLPESANLSTTTTSVAYSTNGINVIALTGTAFSSTTNVIGFNILNIGVASTSFRQATTGIQYWILR